MNSPLSLSMQSIFWPTEHTLHKKALLVLSGVFLLVFASQISIPLLPVPLTFQSATVVLIGMAYGARYGSTVIATYLLAGLVGIPVFANFSAGPAVFTGPTTGYLIGFLPAAWLSGYLAQKGFARNVYLSFLAACLGVSVIFTLGIAALTQFIGFKQAIALGFAPFVLSETIKLIAVALLIPRFWKS